ncbi:MAG TPA: molybdopterin-dependent oxidoreductase [Thermoanaerobaculia bacterium]|jgi:anaerobic selenocysteine-containing dehydrogenase
MEAAARTAPARIVSSACPLDCPDACSLDVHVEGDRVVAVGGSRVNPLTDGYICAKVRRYPEHVHGPRRVFHPRIREGRKGEGRFRRAGWDEALDLVAGKLSELAGRGAGEAILPLSYGGSNGYLSQDTTDARLFGRLGASRLLRTVCAAPSGRAAKGLYGKMAGIAIPDYRLARLIVLWGVNPAVSGIHLLPHIQAAQKAGGKLVVVDPRRTRLAEQADLHLQIAPGGDLPLALAMIRWLFAGGRADAAFLAAHATGVEELRRRAEPWTVDRAASASGLAAGDIEAFARLYADSSPAALRCGWGLERNRNGGSAVAAVLALPAVAGKFGVRGGGYTMSNSAIWDLESSAAAREGPASTREINMNLVGETLLSGRPPVELLFVYNANPLMTLPEQEKVRRGLLRQDLFTVVFDPVMTDTAAYADVVLPATTFLERREVSRGYGAYVLQDSLPAIPPVGESRSNHEVFADLCRRTGVARRGDPETTEEIAAAVYGSSRRSEALREAVSRDGVANPEFGPSPVQFVDVFPRTPDRKVHLAPEDLDREAPLGLYGFREEAASPEFPLALISPASDRTISSTLGELRPETVALAMHPEDAAARGVTDGGTVRVFNSRGEVRCRARVDGEMRRGVVFLPKGLWSHNTENGATASALAPDTLTDLGGGACFNDARVEVKPSAPAVARTSPGPA